MKETNPGKCITTKSSLKLEDLRITVNKQVENFQVRKLSSFCHSHHFHRYNYVVVDAVMHSQDPPSGMKDLLPQVLEVLLTEGPQFSACYQDCFS